MSIIPTLYIRYQIALHAAVNRAREIGDRAPTLANLLDLDAACGVIDQLERGTEAADVCRCGHRRHEGDCGVFVEPRARYCTCTRFEPAV